MKYKIAVLKESESLYVAYCPVMPDIRAAGDSMDGALASLRQEMLCYLHDESAEFEIMIESKAAPASHETTGGAL